MAILTKSDVVKGNAAQFTLDIAALAALPVVAADPFFSNPSNWKHISLSYKSAGGQKKNLVFDASGTAPKSTFSASAKSRLGSFQIQSLKIHDFDGGYLPIPVSQLVASEFNVAVLSPIPVPSAPTNIFLNGLTGTKTVRISSNVASGATSYKFYRNTTNTFTESNYIGSSTTLSYDDADPSTSFGVLYYYAVKGVNAGGESAFGPIGSFKMLTWTSQPVITPGATSGDFTITWNQSQPGAEEFEVFYSLVNDTQFDYALVAQTSPVVLTGLQGNGLWVLIRAMNTHAGTRVVNGSTINNFAEAYSQKIFSAALPPAPAAVPPANLQVIPQDGGFGNAGVTLTWDTDPSAVGGYVIYRDDQWVGQVGPSDSYFFDNQIFSTGDYVYKVAAINSINVQYPAPTQTVHLNFFGG